MWTKWEDEKPEPGQKIAVVCRDGCSARVALVVGGNDKGSIMLLDGEDGWDLGEEYARCGLWAPLPETYPIHFMEVDDRP